MNCGESQSYEDGAASIVMSHTPATGNSTFDAAAQRLSNEKMSIHGRKTRSGLSSPQQASHIGTVTMKQSMVTRPTSHGSPKSSNSETSQTPTASRRPLRGCKFETGMASAKRRVPYSLGPERLAPEPHETRRKLGDGEARRVTAAMQDLFAQLSPSDESEERRGRFLEKLRELLQSRWPSSDIQVSVFGSTGNCLGTSESDLDVCITTPNKDIENVCSIAELLAKNGMQRVVCVSSAKVPIVKVWDPDLQVACDMNVNNPVALENTQLIRSYIQSDPRVRPLAMIIKYWAKRRILNDAALGGTLSSYTWICMLLNFLQTIDPPILPCLQRKTGLEPVIMRGVNVAFDKDLDKYKGFGQENKSSLGELLFQFFKYFGHDFDFEGNVLSVRLGAVIPKSQKSWHLLQDNRLCVEEPFNTARNLANTADDTSMRGIHLELRRAFRCLVEGDLLKCCEQYVSGPEETRQTATFIHPTSTRPTLSQAPTQSQSQNARGNKIGYRGSRTSHRNSAPRRASNTANRNPNYLHDLPFQMTPQELQLQQQHQQHLLHDQLFQQYQFLQLQEQELRMQLYQQSMRQRGFVSSPPYSQSGIPAETSMRLPSSSSVYQGQFSNNSSFVTASTPTNGIVTNPASPLLNTVIPEGPRYTRRTSGATSVPPASMRAHSQPARPVASINAFHYGRPNNEHLADSVSTSDRRSSFASRASVSTLGYLSQSTLSSTSTLYDAGRRPAEFMGYYIGQSPSLSAHTQSTVISPIPSHSGLAIHNGGLSPRLSSHEPQLHSDTSSPSLRNLSLDNSQTLAGIHGATKYPPSPPLVEGPLVIDGSLKSAKRRHQAARNAGAVSDNYTMSTSNSEERGVDTPATSEDHFQETIHETLPTAGDDVVAHTLYNSRNGTQPISLPDGILLGDLKDPGRTELVSEQEHDSKIPSRREVLTNGDLGVEPPHRAFNGQAAYDERGIIKGDTEISPSIQTAMAPVLHSKTNDQEMLGPPVGPSKATDAVTGWQVQKKRNKKPRRPVRSENDAMTVNLAGGDLLPLDESLRKGG